MSFIAYHQMKACLVINCGNQINFYQFTTEKRRLTTDVFLSWRTCKTTWFCMNPSHQSNSPITTFGSMICVLKRFSDLAGNHDHVWWLIIANSLAVAELAASDTAPCPYLEYKWSSRCQLSYHEKIIEPSPTWSLIINLTIYLIFRIFFQPQEHCWGNFTFHQTEYTLEIHLLWFTDSLALVKFISAWLMIELQLLIVCETLTSN